MKQSITAGYLAMDEALEAYREAIRAFEEALGLAPNDAGLHNSKGNALLRQADVLARLGKHEQALEACGEAIEAHDQALGLTPNDATSRYNAHNGKGAALAKRADLLALRSKHEQALKAYEETIEAYDQFLGLAPNDARAHNKKGIIPTRRADLGLAANNARTHINKGDALLGWADLLAQLSKHDRALEAYQMAIETYDQALDLVGDYPYLYSLCGKARALLNRGKLLLGGLRMGPAFGKRPLVDAQNLYNRALQIAPDHTSAQKGVKEVSKLIEEIEDGTEQ